MGETSREGRGEERNGKRDKEGKEGEKGGGGGGVERGRERDRVYTLTAFYVTKLHIFKYRLYLVLYNMLQIKLAVFVCCHLFLPPWY